MCTVWVSPREYHPNEKGLAELVANLWKTLLNTSRATFVNTSRTSISFLHGTPGYKLLKSIQVVPRPSQLSRSRLEVSQEFFVNSKSVLLEDGLSPQMEHPHVHSHFWNRCWIWQQRCGNNPVDTHKFGLPPVINLLHVWKTWHRLLQLGPRYAADPAILQQFYSPLCRTSDRAGHSDADLAGGTTLSQHRGTSGSPTRL